MELVENPAKSPKRGSLPLRGAFCCTLLITSVFFALLLTLGFIGYSLTVSKQLIFIIIIDFLFFAIILIIPYLYLQLDNTRRSLLFAFWMPFCNLLFILSLTTVIYLAERSPFQAADTVIISAIILFIIWNLSSLYIARGEQAKQKFHSGGKLTLFLFINLLTTPLSMAVGFYYETFDSKGMYFSVPSVWAAGILWGSLYLNGLFFCLQKDSLLVYIKGWFACFIIKKEKVKSHLLFGVYGRLSFDGNAPRDDIF